jgi:hypothetical protein
MAQNSRRAQSTPPAQPTLHTRMVKLTEHHHATLTRIAKDLADYSGRRVSAAAILRALVAFADTQGYQWTLDTLSPHVEAEVNSGIVWGYHPHEPYPRQRKRAARAP